MSDLFETLNVPGKALRARVEQLYGRPVMLKVRSLNPNIHGNANVLDNGQPFVLINSDSFDPTTTLVHELFHLKLRAEGVPSIFRLVNPKSSILDPEIANIVQNVTLDVKELVAHWIFYDSMYEMGYQPRRAFNHFVGKLLSRNPLDEIRNPIQQPIIVARVLLEADDHELITQFLNVFPQPCVEKGRLIAALIRQSALHSGELMAECVVKVIDFIVKNQGVRATLRGWEVQLRGQLLDRVVVVRFTPDAP